MVFELRTQFRTPAFRWPELGVLQEMVRGIRSLPHRISQNACFLPQDMLRIQYSIYMEPFMTSFGCGYSMNGLSLVRSFRFWSPSTDFVGSGPIK